MEIRAIGICTHHDKTESLCYPNGIGVYIFLQAITPAFINTIDGRTDMLPGQCILVEPDFPHYLAARTQNDSGFANNWITLGDDSASIAASDYGLPLNSLLHDSHPQVITALMQTIFLERVNRYPHHQRRISLLLEEVFLHLSREQGRSSSGGTPLTDHLEQLRNEIHLNPQSAPSVHAMASDMGLSPSRFSVLYKTCFAITPKQDIIYARTERAKLLMSSGNYNLAYVAAQCGFENEYYFSKVFKNQVGCPPGAYRRHLQKR